MRHMSQIDREDIPRDVVMEWWFGKLGVYVEDRGSIMHRIAGDQVLLAGCD